MKNYTYLIGLSVIAAASAVTLYAAAPGSAPATGAATASAPATGPAAAPAGGRRGGGARGGAGGARGGGAPVHMNAAIPNALPGLLGKPIKWKSTAPLVLPVSDATHFLFSVKDPTISFIDGKWEIYATANMIMGPQAAAASQPGNRPTRGGTWNMIHVQFADFKDAPSAKLHYMDADRNFGGYKCAPEMFYFTPQKKWYLTFQTQPPQFATSTTPADPMSWSRPQAFFDPGARTPGGNGVPGIDYHFIGDGEFMYLFYTGDDGGFYRSRTKYADFPKGWSEPVAAMKDNGNNTIFEAGFTYKIKGVDKYLTCIEGLGGGRHYSAFVADKLDGEWYPVQGFNTPQQPFAGKANMTFEDGVKAWSGQVSHGEMIRDSNDERMILDPNNLQFLYQGMSDAENGGDYGALPYKLGLLRTVKE